MQSCLAFGLVAGPPRWGHAFAGNTHCAGDMGFGPAVSVSSSTMSILPRWVVRALRWDTRTSGGKWAFDKPHLNRRFSSHQADTPATNVLAGYT